MRQHGRVGHDRRLDSLHQLLAHGTACHHQSAGAKGTSTPIQGRRPAAPARRPRPRASPPGRGLGVCGVPVPRHLPSFSSFSPFGRSLAAIFFREQLRHHPVCLRSLSSHFSSSASFQQRKQPSCSKQLHVQEATTIVCLPKVTSSLLQQHKHLHGRSGNQVQECDHHCLPTRGHTRLLQHTQAALVTLLSSRICRSVTTIVCLPEVPPASFSTAGSPRNPSQQRMWSVTINKCLPKVALAFNTRRHAS